MGGTGPLGGQKVKSVEKIREAIEELLRDVKERREEAKANAEKSDDPDDWDRWKNLDGEVDGLEAALNRF